MKIRIGAAAIGFVLIGLAAPERAQATVVSGTITGVLAPRPDNGAWNNQDVLSFFGGGNLNGDAVTVNYSFDTSFTTLSSTATFAQYTASGQLAPDIFSLSVTINGHTVTADGTGNHINDFREANEVTASIVSNSFYTATSGSGAIQLVNFLTTQSYSASLLDQPYLSDFTPANVQGDGGIPLVVQNASGAGELMFISEPTTSSSSSVPEPTSLALLGTALIALSRKRRVRA